MLRRATVRRDTSLTGVGLFTARPVTLTIRPADPSRAGGLWFRRADLPGRPACRATVGSLSSRPVHPAFAHMPPRSTTLETAAGDLIATTEHVLSALVALGVTDALLDLTGPEIPLMDASALDFARAVQDAGIDLGPPLEPITLTGPMTVRDRDAWITATPRAAPGCTYRYDLEYSRVAPPGGSRAHAAAPPLSAQSATWDGSPATYLRDIAPARTFCLQAEAEGMRAAGLLRHLSERDALVIGADGPIDNAYRFPDEPARHKLLDLVGDLALVGVPLQADIHASRAGHALNHRLAREIFGAHLFGLG